MYLFRDATLEANKETRAALRKIYGVGWRKAIWAASKLGLSFPFYLNQINGYNFSFLSSVLKLGIISDVRIKRKVSFNIARLIGINSLKGLRHKLCLPVHGQRTRTNACTQRLKRVRSNFSTRSSANSKKRH